MKSRPWAAIAVLALAALPVLAHHSFAGGYDSSKPVTLKGRFLKMDWVNPHSWIHLQVVNPETHKTEVWDVEAGPPNILYRNGWRRDSLKRGDEIVVTGTLARSAAFTANARSVRMPDGRTLLAGSSESKTP